MALQKGQTASARHWLDELRRAEGETGVFWRYGACAILVHEARRRRANLDEARRHLHEINRIHKNWPRAAALAGAIAEMEGNYQLAIREYGRALDHSEPQPGVLTQLLEILIQRREFGKADSEVTKYEQKQPLTPDIARLGAEAAMGLRDKQSTKVALRRAESAVTMPIRDYRDALWLSAICQAAGESARAEELLTSALNVAGHAPDVWLAWMEFLARSNQRKRVSQEIDRMEKTLHKNRVPLTRARCYDGLQQLDQAASAYLMAVAGAGDDPTVLSFAADFFRRADLNDDARGFYERLLDPALAAPAKMTVDARRRLAVLLAKSDTAGDRDRALALMDDNRNLRGDTLPDLRVRLYVRGRNESFRRNAIHQFQETLRRQTPSIDERLLLAELLVDDAHLGQARTILSDVNYEDPTNGQCIVRFVNLLIHLKEFAKIEPTSVPTIAAQAALVRAEKESAAKMK
ncbi:MAG: hypothetical protein EXS16_12875 [Gemmataceae bacterium]|nr:hypothetical protein [Gemmataceae bacterium]